MQEEYPRKRGQRSVREIEIDGPQLEKRVEEERRERDRQGTFQLLHRTAVGNLNEQACTHSSLERNDAAYREARP